MELRWTLVTGGAWQLGAEICRILAVKGYPLLIHYRKSFQEAQEVAAFCRRVGAAAEILEGDFSTASSVETFLQKLEGKAIAHIIHNVGPYSKRAFPESVEEWPSLFQLNFFAPVAITQKLLPALKSAQGSVTAVGVSGLETRTDRHFTGYRLSKLCLLRFMRNLAREVAIDGVRANMVSPGQLEFSLDLPNDLAALPMQRAGRPEEVAKTIAFLLEQRYITGQNIEVAGGLGL